MRVPPLPTLRHGRSAPPALVFVLAVIAGCGTQSPMPSSSFRSAPTGSAASDTPAATAAPTEQPTSTPTTVDEWSLAEIEDVPDAGYGGAFPQAIVVGGPGLVAVGSVSPCCADVAYDDEPWSAVVWTSPDGRRWELLPDLASFGRAGLLDVAGDDDGQMLAVGYEVLPPDPARPEELLRREMRAWRSTDGIDWFSVPTPEGEARSAAWSGGEWIIGGESGGPEGDAMVWTSTDLETWTAEELGPGSISEVTASDHGTLVATGVFDRGGGSLPATEAVTRAPDGTWSRAELDGNVLDLVWHPVMGFVGVGFADEGGEAAGASWSSVDGVAWQSSHFTGSDLASIDTVVVADDVLFGVASATEEGGAPSALWSTDGGRSWTLVGRLETPPGTGSVNVRAAAFRDAQYLVLGSRFREVGGKVYAWHGP
jgi:hypothetical protein